MVAVQVSEILRGFEWEKVVGGQGLRDPLLQKAYHRPISILSTISKIVERAAHNQLYAFIQDNTLLMNGQHGFRQRRSMGRRL